MADLTREQLRAVELASRYCKTLAAVERAHALGDSADFEYVLGNVDPVDLRHVVSDLETIFRENAQLEIVPAFDVTHAGDLWSKRA